MTRESLLREVPGLHRMTGGNVRKGGWGKKGKKHHYFIKKHIGAQIILHVATGCLAATTVQQAWPKFKHTDNTYLCVSDAKCSKQKIVENSRLSISFNSLFILPISAHSVCCKVWQGARWSTSAEIPDRECVGACTPAIRKHPRG